MATQTALIVETIGAPVISHSTFPVPQPGPKQIQVRVTVAGLNPHDQKGRDIGLFIKNSLPAILGSDVVGIVTTLGDGVRRFAIGDRVFGQASMAPVSVSKALQEYAVLDENFAATVPEGISEDEAATLPTNLLAGVIGFFDSEAGLAIPPPWSEDADPTTFSKSSILIIGGGSNCGRFATQLANLAGFKIIVVVGGKAAGLQKFGATHVVDRHGGHDIVLQRVRDIVGDDLLYAFDAYNGPDGQHLAINALSNLQRGKLARLVWSRGSVQEDKILPKQSGFELKNVLGISHFKPEAATPFWQHASEYLVLRKIKPLDFVTVQGLDAVKVNEVLDAYRDGKAVVQTHFRISE
ncbi:putative alcohol dehydrogenase [Ophiobolus disseminans]|uniref:Putative alcohol dehydrogenase n=1 Tax=Ophiobolus disseminans TaxID=1469910 RepID=A0A6A6ZKZ1_9PLEO|nr:putative alcohol dehydrogenase [Ophiobolus disseminans]